MFFLYMPVQLTGWSPAMLHFFIYIFLIFDQKKRNKYSINSFYYSTGNHTQRRFQSDDLSLIVHYKFLT